MNQALENMAQTLFRSWFVEFDPVHAKCEGRPPTGLDMKTAALFPSRFTSNYSEKVPDGWLKSSILSICQILSGGTPRTSIAEYWDGPLLWASAKDVSQCDAPYLIETERTITERGLNESATQLIPTHSTVIIARGATMGRMTMLGQQMAMNQTCYALHSEQTPRYLFSLLANTVFTLRQVAHGSVFDTITTATFETTPVIIPPPELRRAFETAVAPLFERILHNLRESQTLSDLRGTLLPKLLSGEIRIKDAETKTGAAL